MSVNLGTAYAELQLKTQGFKKGITEAKSDLDSFQNKANVVASGLKGVGGTLTSIGGTLTKTVTAPIVAMGTAAVKTTATFDTSMSKVQALTGATGKDFQKLRDYAIEMGGKTAFSASEAADAMSYMGLAGWKTEQMIEGLPGILDLAAASQMDLAQASDMVTDYLTAFGLEAKDATKMANQMSYAQANSNTTTQQLGDAFGNCAAQMHTAGQTMETTTAFLEAMANQGLKGSEAGTALSATIRDITQKMDSYNDAQAIADAKAAGLVSVTGNLNDILGKNAITIGDVLVPVSDLNGNFRDLTDIMKDVEKATNGMGSAEKSAALLTTFTARSIKAVSMSLTEGVDNIKDYKDALNDVDGVASEMAETMLKNFNGQLTILKSTIETLMIQIGDTILPTFSKLVDKFREIVIYFTKLDQAQKEQIIKWAAIAAAIGPALLVLGKFTTSIGGLVSTGAKLIGWLGKAASAFGVFGGAAGSASSLLAGLASTIAPILAIVAAVAALGVALKKLYDQNGKFTESVNKMTSALKEDFLVAVEKAKEVFNFFKENILNAIELIKSNFDFSAVDSAMAGLTDAFMRFYEAIKPVGQFLAEVIGAVLATIIIPALSNLIGIVNGLVSALAPLIRTITDAMNILADLWNIITGFIEGLITGDFTKLKSAVSSLVGDIKAFVSDFIETIKAYVSGFLDGLFSTLDGFTGGAVTKVGEFFSNLWETIKAFFTETIPAAFDTFVNETLPNFIESAKQFFEQLPYNLGYAVGEALQKLIDWGHNMKQWVATNVPIIINNIIKFFQQLPGKIWTWLQNTINKVIQWGAQMKQKAIEYAKAFVDTVIDFVKELPGKVYDWIKQVPEKIKSLFGAMREAGSGLMNNLWEGLKSIWESIEKWFNGIIEKVKEFIKGIKDGMKDAKDSSKGASSSSNADGLAYVPFNGYKATLHEGEKVLTKNEASAYGQRVNGGNTFIFQSPKALDPYESSRLFKETIHKMEEGFA